MTRLPLSSFVVFGLALLLAAGCVSPAGGTKPGPTHPNPLPAVAFGTPRVIDPVRSGGEPVMFVTPKDTLIMAVHPGFTHVKTPPGPEVLTPANGQSYIFRSIDHGATWTYVPGLLPMGAGPRNDAPGVSDPTVASNPDGSRLVFADLEAVGGVSSSASTDDGATWPNGQPDAGGPGAGAGGSVDRPWLTFADGSFFLLFNGGGGGKWAFRASADGLTWHDQGTPGDGSFPGMMATGPKGEIYIGNGDKVWASTDQGKTFASSKVGGKPLRGITAQPPAVDDNGTVYFAWSQMDSVWYAASHDQGRTWGTPVDLTAHLAGRAESNPGTHIWPWPVAGAAGRLAVVWLGTNQTSPDPSTVTDEWTVHAAYVTDADGGAPQIQALGILGAVAMRGGICISGTTCEAAQKDRRLGDFITVAADHEGLLQIAYGTTTTGHSISSPAYVAQTVGPRLR